MFWTVLLFAGSVFHVSLDDELFDDNIPVAPTMNQENTHFSFSHGLDLC